VDNAIISRSEYTKTAFSSYFTYAFFTGLSKKVVYVVGRNSGVIILKKS